MHGPVPAIYLSLQQYGRNHSINDLHYDAFDLSFRKFKWFEKLLFEVYSDSEGKDSIERIKEDYNHYKALASRIGFTKSEDGIILIDEFDDNARDFI